MNPTDHPDRGSLAGALDAIATGAARAHGLHTGPDGGLDVADIRAAARRRRTRFEAGLGLAAATVAVALVLGGAALSRTDRHMPPADVPHPTASSPGPGACPVAVPEAEVVHGPLVVELHLDADSVPAPGVVTGDAVVYDDGTGDAPIDPAEVGPELAGQLEFVLLQGNLVVAAAPNTAADPQGLSGRLGSATPIALELRSCSGGTVPAGDYVLAAVLRYPTRDSSFGESAVIGVTPLTIRPAHDDAPNLPACGAWTGGLAPSSGSVTARAQVRVGGLDTDNEFAHRGYGNAVDVEAELVNNGADLPGALGIQTQAVVVRDGVVVAALHGEQVDPPPVDWPTDGARSTGLLSAVVGCDGEALAPGDYELWFLAMTSSVQAEGTTPVWHFAVIAPPVPFHIYGQDHPDPYGPVTYTAEGEIGWSDVDVSALPTDVPLGLAVGDTLDRARVFEDGRRWIAQVSFTDGTEEQFADITAALVAAGFSGPIEDEAWAMPLPGTLGFAGVFTRADYTVKVRTEPGGDGRAFGELLIIRTT